MNLYEYQRSRSYIYLGPCHLDSTFSNFFSLETATPIEANIHMEPPRDMKIKMNTNGLCQMADMPIYGKELKNLLL